MFLVLLNKIPAISFFVKKELVIDDAKEFSEDFAVGVDLQAGIIASGRRNAYNAHIIDM